MISTHTLTWSVTCSRLLEEAEERISTHTLTWSVTRYAQLWDSYDVFQLTRSRGAWPFSILSTIVAVDFNSHAHVERDVLKELEAYFGYNFNSHAHVERDPYKHYLGYVQGLISTHTLTWSVTKRSHQRSLSLKFQLTRSRGAWHGLIGFRHFVRHISTHTLTWSVTYLRCFLRTSLKFQLTRSRGAWLPVEEIQRRYRHFNSHAHVERDEHKLHTGLLLEHFNSHAHVERDLIVLEKS